MYNNDYMYAIERSDEYLAHYGVRGMKWGVQKAKYRGDDKALSKHYSKAMKKLNKYKDKMNINKQKEAYEYHKGKAKRSGAVAAGLLGVGLGGTLGGIHSWKSQPNPGTQKVFRPDLNTGKTILDDVPIYKSQSSNTKTLGVIGAAGLAGAGISGSKAGYHVAKAIAAKSRTTKQGHKKAVQKYGKKADAWQREMNRAFAGTKYAKKRK